MQDQPHTLAKTKFEKSFGLEIGSFLHPLQCL